MDGSDSRLYAKLFNLLKSCETELLAYRVVYEAMQASGHAPDLAPALRAAKNAVKSQMDEKYDQAIEKLTTLQDEQEILQALENLQCGKPLN
jgi:hypothetical protein